MSNFEAKLRKQKFESEIDSKWLQQEETKRLSFVATSQNDNSTSEALQYPEKNEQQKETSKTLSIDRTNDNIYLATTNVVKAIMLLSKGVEKAAASEYLELVRYVGIELRQLLSSVDALASIFPPQALKYAL